MDYYKFLPDHGKEISILLKKYVLENNHLLTNKYSFVFCNTKHVLESIPELADYFQQYKLTVKHVFLFVSRVRFGRIHLDNDFENPLRVNFPVLNCEDTETIYYKTTVSGRPIEDLNMPTTVFQPSDVIAVCKYNLSSAVIMKTQEIHQVVVNHNNFPRVSCTIACNGDLFSLFNSL
jgi:hypothetical protein